MKYRHKKVFTFNSALLVLKHKHENVGDSQELGISDGNESRILPAAINLAKPQPLLNELHNSHSACVLKPLKVHMYLQRFEHTSD